MSRAAKIEKILERRAEHSQALGEMDANLAAVTEALARLDEARVDLLDGADDDARQLTCG